MAQRRSPGRHIQRADQLNGRKPLNDGFGTVADGKFLCSDRLISGNRVVGIWITPAGSGTVMEGNIVDLDQEGLQPVSNGDDIVVDATSTGVIIGPHLVFAQGAGRRDHQSQKLLPDSMSELNDQEFRQVVDEVRQLQGHGANPQIAPRIPRILFSVTLERLQPVDARALIMMGALKERKGFVSREFLKLAAARPDIRRM